MNTLREIHLIHHTHTDFGYTDLPETTVRLHREYIREAIELAERYEHYPDEARFRWTLEILLPVSNFLRHASEAEKSGLFRCIDAGLLELTAMPCHISALIGEGELLEVFRRLDLQQYRPKVAFQNDINGFPWGLMPHLIRQGVETLWMGVNLHCSPPVGDLPSFRWWEGPDGSRLLVYMSLHYCEGYFWFHKDEWRRGPVPCSSSVWHHPPERGQIWNASPENLEVAHTILLEKQAMLLKEGYPLDIVALQVTNMWRMDNDPPFEGLPDFVRAWNEAGYEPRLRLSTCGGFINAVKKSGVEFPVFRGDWQDWWSDGVASTPVETALAREAQRDFQELRAGAACLQVELDEAVNQAISTTAEKLILATEHTWGGYASVARPYEPLSVGNNMQKRATMYQAWEDTLSVKAEIIRKSSLFTPFSKTRALAVCNPGGKPRSGWIEFEASALREKADAVRCEKTGAMLPLEVIYGPEWAETDKSLPTVYEFPGNIWNVALLKKRFFVSEVGAGEIRHFELLHTSDTAIRNKEAPVKVEFNAGLPSLLSLEGHDLLETGAPHRFGAVVIETADCPLEVRTLLEKRQGDLGGIWKYELPELREYRGEASFYAERHVSVWSAPAVAHRIEQQWDIFRDLPRVELTTTFWLKNIHNLTAIYLSFPFHLPGAKASYDSLGVSTEFGKQQMPDTCGEYAIVGSGVTWQTPGQRITMACPDSPLGCMDSLKTRQTRLAFTPETQRFYTMVANNHWATNFPALQAGKLVTRHIFDFASQSDTISNCHTLWAFPTSSKIYNNDY